MTTVRRIERITLDRAKAIRLDNGMMRVPARLSRVGVFEYRRADGSIERALRLPEDVFHPDSMASFDQVPVTDGHPFADGGEVTAENAKRLQVGSVGNVTKEQDRFLSGTVMITDAKTIAQVDAGKREVSCGYYCDREPAAPGAFWHDAESGRDIPYDFIQRNIRGNHVAIVDEGRAGREVRLQLDSTDAVLVEGSSPKVNMNKITIDGLEVEVSPLAAQVIAKHEKLSGEALEASRTEVNTLKSALEKKTAQCDAADAKVAKLEAQVKEASDPVKLATYVAERVSLESTAKTIAGAEFKCDGLDSMAIKRAVVAKVSAVKCDGKSDDYANALFDGIVADHAKTNPVTAAIDAAQKSDPTQTTDTAETPRQKSEREFFAGPAQK